MRNRASRIPPRRSAQQGVAIIVIVAVIVVGALAISLSAFNAASMKADRYRVTQDALTQAKAALIGRAVAEDDAVNFNTVRPGSLPCPDTNDDGVAELFVGNDCPSYLGRLPWKTLDLPDLRDASGERLWYALSRNFRDDTSAQPINSNTRGTLSMTMTGGGVANELLAVVIAPGSSLRRSDGVSQSRTCPGASCYLAANYLDVALGVNNANAGATSSVVSTDESDTFNDRMLPVYSDDILPLVERRVGREYAQKLREHFDAWKNTTNVVNTKGFYPWAATFDDPGVNSPGVNGTAAGQLPLSASSVVWSSAASTLGTCSGVGSNQIQCGGFVFCFFSTCLLNITARVGGVATAFVDPPTSANVTVTGLTLGGATSTWTLNPTAQALDFSFNSGSFLGIAILTVTVKAPTATAWTAGTGSSQWLANNSWGQVTYYSLSPRYAINGAGDCAVPAQCLSVTNGVTTATNKEAVVVTAGRPLTALTPTAQASPRPAGTASLANYLEGQNLAVDTTFQQGMRSTQFNDQTTIVRP